MAIEEVPSKIYGKPNFRLIVGMFAASIVVLLLLGWLFLRSDLLKVKSSNIKRTGMTILYQPQPVR